MYLSIPVIIFLVGVGMVFIADRKVTGIVTACVGLTLMGAVNIPYFSDAVRQVQSFF